MAGPGDVLTAARLAAAAAMPVAITRGGIVPVVLWCVAALTDFVDGPAARRWGGSRYGALLDPAADVAFVLATLVPLAAAGRVAWIVPLSIVASVAAYAVASVRASRGRRDVHMARSYVGHAAGVVNYGAAGVAAAAATWPASLAPELLAPGGVVVVLVNGAAIAERSLWSQLPRRAA